MGQLANSKSPKVKTFDSNRNFLTKHSISPKLFPMESLYYTLNPWWEGKGIDTGVSRDLYLKRLPDYLKRKQVEIFIGSRRTGKTTLLKQFIKVLLDEQVSAKEIFYLPLDHPLLSGSPVADHLKAFRKLFSHPKNRKLFLFLDEVQENPNWETEIKSLYDLEGLKIFCTGSTSSLVTRQGGKLTGRQIINILYPLCFREFVVFKGEIPSLSEDYRYESLAEAYLNTGGYPEQVLNPSDEYMTNLLDDILSRDLIRLYPIKKPLIMKELLRMIGASVGARSSFNKLAKVIGLSLDTVREYVGYLEAAFLISPLEKWTTSVAEKIYAQKKIYLWDNGVKTILTGTGNMGVKAENAVYLELKRRQIPAGYFAESEREIDFVTGSYKNPLPIEAKYITSYDWKDKRFSGVRLFLRRFPETKRVLIISENVETEAEIDGHTLTVVPLWKFLLQSESFVS
jgi:predicted AAA+ superfamily ATPase